MMNNNNNSVNKGSKVGSRVTSSSSALKAEVSKRLRITAESTEAPLSAAEGILAGLNKNGSMLASVGTRAGIEEVLVIIAPLTAAIEMGKKMVRRSQGLIVTPAMQEDLRQVIAWQANTCGAALVGSVYEPPYDPSKSKKKQQTTAGMLAKERRLVAKMQEGTPHRSSSSSSSAHSVTSTASPSTRSSRSSGSAPSSISSKYCSFAKASRGVVYFARVARVSPGAAFVPAVRPSARVDPRVSHLSGSGAIRR